MEPPLASSSDVAVGWGQKGRLWVPPPNELKGFWKCAKGTAIFSTLVCSRWASKSGRTNKKLEISLFERNLSMQARDTRWVRNLSETGLREGQAWQQLPKQGVQSGLPTRGLSLKAKQRLLTGWLKKMDSFWAGWGEEERHSVLGGPGHLRAEGDDNGCKAKPVLWHKTANPLR